MTNPPPPANSALCPYANQCGACAWIGLPYPDQLARKQRRVEQLFANLVDERTRSLPIRGMEHPWHYRNKVVSPFVYDKGAGRQVKSAHGKRADHWDGRRPWGKGRDRRAGNRRRDRFDDLRRGRGDDGGRSRNDSPYRRTPILTGMYRAGTHQVVQTDGCYVENEVANGVVVAIRDLMPRFHITPYDEDLNEGFLRHVVVRVGHASGEVLVTLVTNDERFPGSKGFCRELKAHVPEVTSVIQNVNTRQTNVIMGDEGERTLFGPGFILDELCGLRFRISSHSFYQVNGVQTTHLYEAAVDAARLTGTETVLDAYCGTGTIGLIAAKRLAELQTSEALGVDSVKQAGEVLGVDSVKQAIKDAQNNAHHNGVDNARFVAEDAGRFMTRLAAQGQKVDVLFLDPPRAGASQEFLEAALALAPSRIVYISCNPNTQARDAAVLHAGGYRLDSVQPVDMFPHTDHIECIVAFERA